MYNKIKKEIKQNYYIQNYPNDGQRFVAWYVRNVHGLDENQAKYAVTDGADDKQIDAIVIDDDNSIAYIIQGKFIGWEKIDAEPLREVLSSWVQVKNIAQLQENANEKLKKRLVDLGESLDDGYEIIFELVTTAVLTESAQKDLDVFQKEIAQTDDFTANFKLIHQEELSRRYEEALQRENPILKHSLTLESDKLVRMKIAGTKVIIAAVQLKSCLSFPGIDNGTLFQKNVRQSLGISNKVNQSMKNTIYGQDAKEFFFYHNGITAICNRIEEKENNQTEFKGISVVNGCQSLNTIIACSEEVKKLDNSYVLFRFYEIPERDRADKISISTNSQSTVKARDLRSNDKRVLTLKRTYEQRYYQGFLITKRGEQAPANKDKNFVLDLSEFGKYVISWHSQRPNIAYSETKIFDKYFEQIFKKDYKPEDTNALNLWMHKVLEGWVPANPFGFNETLLAMKAYAPYHHLYAVSMIFAVINQMPEGIVPIPTITWEKAEKSDLINQAISIAATCLNSALEAAANEPQPSNRVFSPQNWIKAKQSLVGIRAAIRQYFVMLPNMPMGKETCQKIKDSLKMDREEFEDRWTGTD